MRTKLCLYLPVSNQHGKAGWQAEIMNMLKLRSMW